MGDFVKKRVPHFAGRTLQVMLVEINGPGPVIAGTETSTPISKKNDPPDQAVLGEQPGCFSEHVVLGHTIPLSPARGV